jgi:hypothetical protein
MVKSGIIQGLVFRLMLTQGLGPQNIPEFTGYSWKDDLHLTESSIRFSRHLQVAHSLS